MVSSRSKNIHVGTFCLRGDASMTKYPRPIFLTGDGVPNERAEVAAVNLVV